MSEYSRQFIINPHKQQGKKERKPLVKPYSCEPSKDILSEEEADNAAKDVSIGTAVSHKMYGSGKVSSFDGDLAVIAFDSGRETKLNLSYVLKKGIIAIDF